MSKKIIEKLEIKRKYIYIYIYVKIDKDEYVKLIIYCGARGFGNPNPFDIKPMAHAEEEEMSKEEQRKSKLPRYTAEDNPVLDESRSREGKAPRHQGQSPRASQRKAQAQWANHRSIVEKQFQERLLPPH